MSVASWLRGVADHSLLLLAPYAEVPPQYSRRVFDAVQHDIWLRKIQTLRGMAYLADGAIDTGSLTDDGRLVSPWDPSSWHVVARDGNEACATMRLKFYRDPISPCEMGISRSGLFEGKLAGRYHRAICEFQAACFANGGVLCEAGGWATDPACRGTRRSAAVLLSSWPIARSQGKVHTLSMVTARNHSHHILTRMGAQALRDAQGELPPWDDAFYGCRMHLSDIASWRLNEAFEPAAGELASLLRDTPLLMCRG